MRTIYSIALACVLAAAPARAQQRPPLPQGPAGTVTLSVADYDRLVDRAAQPVKREDPPPVPAVVGRAELRARVAGDMVRGTLRLDGEVFHRGHVKVPLVSGGTLLEATAQGTVVPLVQEGDQYVAAILRGPAPFALTLEWAAPVSTAPGRASVALPSPLAGSVTATLDFPGDPVDVRVDPGLIIQRQAGGGRTIVEVTLEPGRGSQVTWSVRESTMPAVQVEARTLADVRSLITIGEADLRMTSLVELAVVSGEPRSFDIQIPAGYEVAGVTGASIDTSDTRPGVVSVTVKDPAQRRHQFFITLERAHGPGSFKADTGFPTVPAAQREVGEVAIEGTGTIEVNASGDEAMRRMDVRESHASLRSIARQPLLAAFRYQRRANETRTLTMDVTRFADAPVIAAAAERAVATTLVTVEGRTLTEVTLTLRNRAQPFMKVVLPSGATMLSVEVGGETAKPVLGADGTRVPLLRPGLRPNGPYTVSFVYLHAGQRFAKRGDAEMLLPQMDVPITVLEWELFLPDRYSAKASGGNVLPAQRVSYGAAFGYTESSVSVNTTQGFTGGHPSLPDPPRGHILGRAVDQIGMPLPGLRIIVRTQDGRVLTANTDARGLYTISNVPPGPLTITGELAGFRTARHAFTFDGEPRHIEFRMQVAALSETVEVRAETPESARKNVMVDQLQAAPSQNVINLQRRVSGVLPVRIDVPRTGTAHRFVKPLVLDEAAAVTFRYKTR